VSAEPGDLLGSGSSQPEGLDRVARRLCVVILGYGIVVAGGLLLLRRREAWTGDLLVLTAGVGAGIFLVRSLRAQVSQLDVRVPSAGGLAGLRALGRFAALALLLLALIEFGSGHALAAALGAASLPAALMVETFVQALRCRVRASRAS
jgi:hypothetical protein